MSDVLDNLTKILKKDLTPLLLKYIKDPNNNLSENINALIDDPQTFLKDIFEIFSKNKDHNIKQESYKDIENVNNVDPTIDNEYDDLLIRLNLIEENMIQIEKILKDRN